MIRNSSRQFGDLFSGFGRQSEKLVALAPVLGAVLHPVLASLTITQNLEKELGDTHLPIFLNQ